VECGSFGTHVHGRDRNHHASISRGKHLTRWSHHSVKQAAVEVCTWVEQSARAQRSSVVSRDGLAFSHCPCRTACRRRGARVHGPRGARWWVGPGKYSPSVSFLFIFIFSFLFFFYNFWFEALFKFKRLVLKFKFVVFCILRSNVELQLHNFIFTYISISFILYSMFPSSLQLQIVHYV
jgi:hypothetical protein